MVRPNGILLRQHDRIKAGERMTLHGKTNSDNAKAAWLKTDTIVKDFGACQP